MYQESMKLKVDAERCRHCGICVRECVNHCLKSGADGLPVEEAGGSARCIHCHHCMMVCPDGALSLDGEGAGQTAMSAGPDSADDLDRIIRNRRSCRYFRREDVKAGDIAELLDLMRYVPTGVNFHQLHFAVIDKLAVMDELRARINAAILKKLEQEPESDAAKKFAGCAAGILSGEDPVFRTAPHLVLVSTPEQAPCADVDPIIALSYFELAAQSRGLATLWCGRAMMAFQMIAPDVFKDVFQIPDGYRGGYVMVFGYAESRFCWTRQPGAVQVRRVGRG